MPTPTKLRIDWATHEAAKYACVNWHYSRSMPIGKLVKVGAWENGNYTGCVIFGRGANFRIGEPYGLLQTQCIELVRVAFTKHTTPISKILSLAVKWLKNNSPGIELVVSYADTEQGHHGGIYQASNWIYSGVSQGSKKVFYKNKWVHQRTVDSILGHHKGFKTRKTLGKHTYLLPLTNEMKQKILPLAKPYPKRAGSKDNVVSGYQSEEGGVNPTPALQTIIEK